MDRHLADNILEGLYDSVNVVSHARLAMKNLNNWQFSWVAELIGEVISQKPVICAGIAAARKIVRHQSDLCRVRRSIRSSSNLSSRDRGAERIPQTFASVLNRQRQSNRVSAI